MNNILNWIKLSQNYCMTWEHMENSASVMCTTFMFLFYFLFWFLTISVFIHIIKKSPFVFHNLYERTFRMRVSKWWYWRAKVEKLIQVLKQRLKRFFHMLFWNANATWITYALLLTFQYLILYFRQSKTASSLHAVWLPCDCKMNKAFL